ncbi:MAG: fimbrillin family protein [Bacteroides sp.]
MSKLTTNLSILFGLALLMLTGCEQNTTVVLPQPGEEPTEVLFSARIAQVEISTRASSNYSEKTGFEKKDEIGLFGWKTETIKNENQYLGNVKLVSNAGGSNLTSDGQKIYFPVQTQTLTLCAYYPYSDTEVSGTEVNIKSELATEEAYNKYIEDPLWGQTSVDKPTSSTPATAQFEMAHRMGRLKIYVYKDATIVETYKLKQIKVTFYNQQAGKMDITSGTISAPNTTESTYTDDYDAILTDESSGTAQYDHTILPAEAVTANSAVKTITIYIAKDGVEASPTPSYEIYNAELGSTAIKPTNGGVTRVNVKFNPTTLTSASVGNWSEQELNINK